MIHGHRAVPQPSESCRASTTTLPMYPPPSVLAFSCTAPSDRQLAHRLSPAVKHATHPHHYRPTSFIPRLHHQAIIKQISSRHRANVEQASIKHRAIIQAMLVGRASSSSQLHHVNGLLLNYTQLPVGGLAASES